MENADRLDLQRANRHRLEGEQIRELGGMLDDPTIEARLKSRAQPHKWGQRKGLNLWDFAAWMWNNAGSAGKLGTLRIIKKALA